MYQHHLAFVICHLSFIKLVAVFAHPADEVFDEDVLVKAVNHKPNIGVAIRIHLDEMWHNHERVGPAVFCIQLFQRVGPLSGSRVHRIVKMEQEQFELFFGGEMVRGQP